MKYYDGYNINQQVYLIKTGYFIAEPILVVGKIIYKGTKRIKVSVEGFDIAFSENKIKASTVMGVIYTLYKTEEEAKKVLEDNRNRKNILIYIKDNINSLSLEQLKDIYHYMKDNDKVE